MTEQFLDENYWPEQKAADFLGVKVCTLRTWSALRRGPARIKVGRRIFYRVSALHAFLESREAAMPNAVRQEA